MDQFHAHDLRSLTALGQEQFNQASQRYLSDIQQSRHDIEGLLNYLESEPVSLANISQLKTELHILISIHDQQSKRYMTFLRTKRAKIDKKLPDQVTTSELRERAEKALAALKPPPATPMLQSLASSFRTSHISGSGRLRQLQNTVHVSPKLKAA